MKDFKLVWIIDPTIDPDFHGEEEGYCTSYLVPNNYIIDINKASGENLYFLLCDICKIYKDDVQIYDYVCALEEEGFEFTWEMIVDIIKYEWFEPEPVCEILLCILSEMKGIDSSSDFKDDDEIYTFINPKTNEKIEIIEPFGRKEINLIEF